MHVIQDVSSHQAVADAAVGGQPTRTSDQNPDAVGIAVVEAFEKLLPSREFVQLIKQCDGGRFILSVRPRTAPLVEAECSERLAPAEMLLGPVA